MDKLIIDYECRSATPIEHGLENYFADPRADILCMAYKLNDSPTRLWVPGQTFPKDLFKNKIVYPFSAEFEYRCTKYLGPRHGIPMFTRDQIIDIMALALRYTFPARLELLGNALELGVKKDPRGKQLIQLLCVPQKDGSFNNDSSLMKELYAYCIRDVDTTHASLKALPFEELSKSEQKNWRQTFDMNLRGIPVDKALATRIQATLEYYKTEEMKKVDELSGGAFQSITQRNAMVNYVRDQGVQLDSLRKEEVRRCLDEEELEPHVRKLLEMRLELAKSSIAKFSKIRQQAYKDRIYDNLYYHGAGTGRLTGRGFQAHNLPRPTIYNAEEAISWFFNDIPKVLKSNPMELGKSLVRATIKAPPGKWLGCADYSSIENRILAFVAGQWDMVELHRKGLDEYKDFAKDFFGINYDDVTGEQRQFSKPVVLGAGFCLSPYGLGEYAQSYGITMTDNEAVAAIRTYRKRRKKIVKFWDLGMTAAINAVTYVGQKFMARDIAFRCLYDRNKNLWLTIKLLSGRTLVYFKPEVFEGQWGPAIRHLGRHPKTKQWTLIPLKRSRVVENIVQATARDILCNGMDQLIKFKFKPVLSVHDEIMCELSDIGQFPLQLKLMCHNPPWALDLPINADGKALKRYAKL